MKLEFLAKGPTASPLVRLYAFSPAEARKLHSAFKALAVGDVEEVFVHDLPFVEPQKNFRLTLGVGATDAAMLCVAPLEYVCELKRSSWDKLAALVAPFVDRPSGFQWLAGAPGGAAWLLSVDGKW